MGGSSGECIYQSVAERKETLEAVMTEVGSKLTIIAHVACNNTADSQELAVHAESLGVDAIAALPPIYFHLPPKGIAKYWNDISAAVPKTDFVIYNIPQLAGVTLTGPLLQEMLKNPKVIGVKNSSMPELYLEILRCFRAGELEEGREVQNECCRIIYKMCSAQGNMYAVIKEIIRLQGGPDVGGVRAPLLELTESDQPVVTEACEMIQAAVAHYCG